MFINNKYTKWYNTIIKVAATRAIINEYHETHHIIPKSLGGSNDSDNLVKLTGREHYICHLLLTKMVQSKYNQMKMDHAAYGMIIMNKTLVTSRIYETLKIKHSNYMKTHNPMFNAETRKKVSESIKKLPARSGFSHSEETKRKMSETHEGEKCHLWKGGISYEPYSIDWTATLKRSIRERDHYTCQLCGKLQSDRAFDVHHIDEDKKNCNPDNLITLCHNCHAKLINKKLIGE
ncbi:HNH endonuclease [bacterium]|nr:HNH endonuclease [bacterium]